MWGDRCQECKDINTGDQLTSHLLPSFTSLTGKSDFILALEHTPSRLTLRSEGQGFQRLQIRSHCLLCLKSCKTRVRGETLRGCWEASALPRTVLRNADCAAAVLWASRGPRSPSPVQSTVRAPARHARLSAPRCKGPGPQAARHKGSRPFSSTAYKEDALETPRAETWGTRRLLCFEGRQGGRAAPAPPSTDWLLIQEGLGARTSLLVCSSLEKALAGCKTPDIGHRCFGCPCSLHRYSMNYWGDKQRNTR